MLSGAQAAGSAVNIIGLKGPALACVKQAASTPNAAPPNAAPPPVISSVLSPIPVPGPGPGPLNVLALPHSFTPVSFSSVSPALNALIPAAGSGGPPKPGHPVNLLPAAFHMGQSSLAIRAMGPVLPRAFLMPQGLTIDRAARPAGIAGALPTVEHLIQSGKDANGLPAYTLITPVQFALPVAPTATTSTSSSSSNKPGVLPATQMPLHIDRAIPAPCVPQQETSLVAVAAAEREPAPSVPAELALNLPPAPVPRAQQWKSCSLCSSLLPLSAYDNHIATAHRAAVNNKPEKIVACANYLQRAGAHICKCLFCDCYVHEHQLFCHLIMHGLTCLFCSQTFHDLAKFTAHTKFSHAGLRIQVVENNKDGASASNQSKEGGSNLTITLPEDEMGPNDIHLTLIPSKMSSPHAPLVIEVCRHKAGEADIIAEAVTPGPPSSGCPFCWDLFRGLQYEKHLHEKHHVAPVVHPLLKIPSFKCIYCQAVYTDHMSSSTISLHLFRCRGLNKMQSKHKYTGLSKRAFSEIGELGAELVSNGDGRNLAPPASKQIKTGVAAAYSEVSPLARSNTVNASHSLPSSDPSTVLALVPKGLDHRPNKERKLFLNDYFHKQPYPSNKEIEVLSSVLSLKKNDVALVFDTKQGSCLKAMKDKPFVLLGFNMSELKKVKHGLRFDFGGTSRKSNRS